MQEGICKWQNDAEGRITEVTGRHRGQEQLLVRYTYNEEGDLSGITDALQQTTQIQYRKHRMVAKPTAMARPFTGSTIVKAAVSIPGAMEGYWKDGSNTMKRKDIQPGD